jgi:hypothetical protein
MIGSRETEPIFSNILEEMQSIQAGTPKRQELINEIENILAGKLILYISSFEYPESTINHDDILPLADLLRTVSYTEKLYLMLHSPGGEPDTAEKIIKICREHCKEFRVVIPNSAKSAATLIALGGDEILMSYISEIGPIDPQILFIKPNGDRVIRPAQSFLDSIAEVQDKIYENGGLIPPIYRSFIENLDPSFLDICKKAIQKSKENAETWLAKYMLKEDKEKAKEIANKLSLSGNLNSHGKMIDYEEAKKLGLKIRVLERDSLLWTKIWELYCRAELYLSYTPNIKLFESQTVSLGIKL